MEPKTVTYFVVEIGGADFYFEKLQDASDFFAKLASTNAGKMGRIGYGSDAYHFADGKHMPEMKQEQLTIYPSRKAAEFAKHNDDEAAKRSED